jgi:hypothetical protein
MSVGSEELEVTKKEDKILKQAARAAARLRGKRLLNKGSNVTAVHLEALFYDEENDVPSNLTVSAMALLLLLKPSEVVKVMNREGTRMFRKTG